MGSNQAKQKRLNGIENFEEISEKKQSKFKARFASLKTGSLRRDYSYEPNKKYEFPVKDNKYAGRKWHSSASLDAYPGRKHGDNTEEGLQLVPARVEDIPDEEKGVCFVNLMKKEGCVMGLTLSGGADREGRPRVSNLRSSGLAAKSDQLQIGDYITAVNGIRTSKLKHGEIISLLKNVGEKVTLEIEYHLPPTTVQTANIIQKTTEITLKKEEDSFGFVLRGGGHEQHRKSRPLVVTHVRPDSPAHKEGRIKTGDRVVSVDRTLMTTFCLEEANRAIAKSGEEAVFTIEYDVSVMDAVKNASGPLLVEVSKTPGVELGITLARTIIRKKPSLCIDRVKPASIADRCGALHVGDQVLSIDNVSTDNGGISVREASEMLNSASDQIKIEILPVSHLALTSAKQFGQNRFAPVITGAQSMSALNAQRAASHLPPAGPLSNTFGRGSNRWNRRRLPQQQQRSKYSASATGPERKQNQDAASEILNQSMQEKSMSLVSTDYFGGNQVVHAEVFEVRLLTMDDGCDLVISASSLPNFGIQLQGGVFATEIMNPIISFVEPERIADRCGVLQAGDRILSINGYPCDQCTVDEVNQLLSDAYSAGQAVLEVEFDVAESVVPSSGTFHAKIPKRRGVDIGIVIAVSGGQHPGSALMISEVRKGSAAYRTGTLEAGDRLLAIDGVRLDECALEDASALLASAEDVVRLKIQKDEENSDDAESNNTISYTVELKRHGGPLGITISGTEEPFDPIFISGLTPGGLADRTGAIREGDKIQSINNIQLRAKPLSEAIALLQSAGEVVTLKIRRQLSAAPQNEPKRSQPSPVISHASPFIPTTTATLSTISNPQFNEAPSELSDPEDDILPPPMGPISGHTQFLDSTPKPQMPTLITPAPAKDRGFRPGPAGAPSVDSAVESWEGSSAETQRTKSSIDTRQQMSSIAPLILDTRTQQLQREHQPSNPSNSLTSNTLSTSRTHKRHDSGRNVEKLRAKFEIGTSRTYSDTWGTKEQIRARTMRSPDRGRLPPSADLQRALDDLQSVGQSSDYLKDLETKLTIDTENETRWANYGQQMPPTDEYGRYRLGYGGAVDTLPTSQRRGYAVKAPQPLRLRLIKDNFHEDFGFSMSDGQLENGVYVHTVKPGSPASRAGLLPYDKVLQVNGVSTHDVDCSMVIALVSPSQTHLELFVTRHPRSLHSYSSYHPRPVLSPPVCLPGSIDPTSEALTSW